MRKKSLLASILAAALFLGIPLTATAEVEKSASAEVSVMTNYVWRGQKLSEDWVVQPSVILGYGGFGVNLWGNYDGEMTEHTETDLTLNYAVTVGKLGLEAGYIYYALDSAPDTQEIYLSAAFDVLFQPSIVVYVDVEEGNGAFLVASIGHSFELPRKVSLNLGASASYNIDNKIMGPGEDGTEFSDFYNGEVSASLSIPVTGDITITPMVAYSFPLSDDSEFALESISFDADDDIVYGGVTAGLEF